MANRQRVFLWAAIGHMDMPPDRVEVAVCEHCAGLVPVDHADRHTRWHRRTEGSMLKVPPRELAAALAKRLDEVAPPGVAVYATDTGIAVTHHGELVGAAGTAEIVEALKDFEGSVQTAARAALSGVQDFIAEATALPWPGTVRQPNPEVRLVDNVLTMWFGDEREPALQLRPLTVT